MVNNNEDNTLNRLLDIIKSNKNNLDKKLYDDMIEIISSTNIVDEKSTQVDEKSTQVDEFQQLVNSKENAILTALFSIRR